jgi:putative DNA primase/helicase
LEWDGGKRIDHWLPLHCAAPNKTIVRAYSRRWMISAVARIMDPGCKVDTTLIMQGAQGVKKSTAFGTLCGPAWFSDTAVDLRDKDALQALQGIWVYEFAELDAVKRSEATATKAFLSSCEDRFRPAYGRNMVKYPRQCVIVGTTNETNFLRDATGSRRFWPVQVGAIDIDGLKANRDQLWAEAVAAYRAGEQWWLTDDEEKRRERSAHLFTEEDAWTEPIVEWLHRTQLDEVTTLQVWTDGLGKRKGDISQVSRKRIVAILRDLGFEKRHTKAGNIYRR